MKLPDEVAVMTLPNATLFPQALLPLVIFEPRYRRMLQDALETSRMFSVAMQKPGNKRESPSPVAGLGLIRASVRHPDGTSRLILQGIARVELTGTVRYKPYRVHTIRPLYSEQSDSGNLQSLIAKVRKLLKERMDLGLPFPFPAPPTGNSELDPFAGDFSPKDVIDYLDNIPDPEQVADLVCCTVLRGPKERQKILETVNLEERFKQLVNFLAAEIRQHKDNNF